MNSKTDSCNIKALIFDYGGTLDTGGDHCFEVLWDAYARANAPFSRNVFREAYIYAEKELSARHLIDESDDFLNTLLKKCRLHLDYCLINKLISSDDAKYSKLITCVAQDCDLSARRCTEKSKAVLESLARRYHLMLVSNSYGNLHSILKGYSLDMLFESVTDSKSAGLRKPDPAIYSSSIKKSGFKPAEIGVVGDSFENDMAPALGLGCKAYWLKGKGWNDCLDEQKVIRDFPDLTIIRSIEELAEYLV